MCVYLLYMCVLILVLCLFVCLSVCLSEADEISGTKHCMAALLSSAKRASSVGLHKPLFESLTRTQSGERSVCSFLWFKCTRPRLHVTTVQWLIYFIVHIEQFLEELKW